MSSVDMIKVEFPNLMPETQVLTTKQSVLSPIHTADADATKQFRPVGVGGAYWALNDALRLPNFGRRLLTV